MIDNYDFCELNGPALATIIGGSSQDISKNIKTLRLSAGFKRTELADMLSLNVSTIARYEEGTRVPDIDTIIDLAHIFHTNIDKIIF
ncbi:helix-turn-helix transcriptional regulator [Leuconostoc gasicomitatum]|uniref:helix-turn-helix domain-containing protein n=1 Tax=Leuconostoc gasicomitatum TaxID=115778 RepID=UPI0007DF1833|nr:helix-turn-helix transcriptional regulator [Leuconostoc gasicomitatum]MBZ5950062.1 helix-turn-helix transcriptional regulator [Leuconostoc gasicomitatum]MBZ5952233.1 helix-turn-helix transcriptional regulator [Leuconostoc gasicomitatum]MBZ5968717.1 helix-turn-helix transcriptional regulator [Leuconostoc gasicomitatum]MBZ5970841.1 helix-turn-helix transcriptional regulator [Leuconostoc gasicomitatum]QFS15737.1 transcriptional regulator [Leuconostoc gasicomitatum]